MDTRNMLLTFLILFVLVAIVLLASAYMGQAYHNRGNGKNTRAAIEAMRDMHFASLRSMQAQNKNAIDAIGMQNERALQAVIIAVQSGAVMRELPNGSAIALLPNGKATALTETQAEYWREIAN